MRPGYLPDLSEENPDMTDAERANTVWKTHRTEWDILDWLSDQPGGRSTKEKAQEYETLAYPAIARLKRYNLVSVWARDGDYHIDITDAGREALEIWEDRVDKIEEQNTGDER